MSLDHIECLIGSNINGSCNQFRSKIKNPKIVFTQHNNFYYMLEKMAKSKIIQEVKLSRQDHLDCLNHLRRLGFKDIKNQVGGSIAGDEISCESNNKLKEGSADNQNLPFKGNIVFSIKCRPFSKGGEFNLSETFTAVLPTYEKI